MSDISTIESLSKATAAILCPPFEWCWVEGGSVILENAAHYGGTPGGTFQVTGFAIAKYPITNAQYEKFLRIPNGFSNPHWWDYSREASQWRKDHQNPKATAFLGSDIPCTRVSWFDSMAFCHWLSAELDSRGKNSISNIQTGITRLNGVFAFQRSRNGSVQPSAIPGGAILGEINWMRPVETMLSISDNQPASKNILMVKAFMECWI